MTRLPNFFIVGAPKCGTTSLAAWLAENPTVYVSPIKEPFYFSTDWHDRFVSEWPAYTKLFQGAGNGHAAVGEASTTYLFSKVAIHAIEREIPGARYIVMIRNPVDMAYSLHEQQLYTDHETIWDFERAWHLSPERRMGRQVPPRCREPLWLDYQAFCKLGAQLERLLTTVASERVLVLVLDDVKENPGREYRKTLEFLGALDDGRQNFPTYNAAKEWRSAHVGRLIRWMGKTVALAKHTTKILPKRSIGLLELLKNEATVYRERPPMSSDFRAELRGFFADDVDKLEVLLRRDFSAWKES